MQPLRLKRPFTHKRLGLALAAVAGFAGFAGTVSAQDISYTYIEGAATIDNFSVDNFSINSGATGSDQLLGDDGFGLSGRLSVALPELLPYAGFHVVADYAESSLNLEVAGPAINGVFDGTAQEFRIAAGANVTLMDRASLYAELGFSQTLIKIDSVGTLIPDQLDDGGGLDARVGLRVAATNFLELNGFARLNPNGELVDIVNGDIGNVNFESAASIGIGAKYNLYKSVNLVADYEFGDTLSRLRVAVRLEF